MIKILFICHGNICRSPLAEFLMKEKIGELGLADSFMIESAATSTEEIGNPIHRGTAAILRSHGIDYSAKRARQMTRDDYDKYDILIGMDSYNLKNMRRIAGGDPDNKMHLMCDYTDHPRDVADPWYTGDFDATYRDVCEGLEGLISSIQEGGYK